MEQSSVVISLLNKKIPTQSSTHPWEVLCKMLKCEAMSTWPQFMPLQENHEWRWTQVISVTEECCFKSTIIEKGRIGVDLTITTGNVVVVLLFWFSSSETSFFALLLVSLIIQVFHQVTLSPIINEVHRYSHAHKKSFRHARKRMQMEGIPFLKYLPIAADSKVHSLYGPHRPLCSGHLHRLTVQNVTQHYWQAARPCASSAHSTHQLSFSQHWLPGVQIPWAEPPKEKVHKN